MNDMNVIVMETLGDLAELLSYASYDASIDLTVGIDETDETEEYDVSKKSMR